MTSPNAECGEDWGQIEQFVAVLTEITQSDRAFEEIAQVALSRTLAFLEMSIGQTWVWDHQSGPRLVCRVVRDASGDESVTSGFDDVTAGSGIDGGMSVERNTEQPSPCTCLAHRSGRIEVDRTEPPATKLAGDRDGAYGCGSIGSVLRIAAPFSGEDQFSGVIEVQTADSISEVSIQGCVRLLAMVSSMMGDLVRRKQLQQIRSVVDHWRQYEMLVQRAHASLDLPDTAYQLVNDGRLFVGWDRAALVLPVRGRWQAIAISGVDSLDRRSDLVHAMEQLALAVVPGRQWIRYRGQVDMLPPQLAEPLCDFADRSNSQCVDVVPLLAPATASIDQPDQLVGILVLERFDSVEKIGEDERIARLANLSSSALRNAIDYQTLPMLSISRWTRRAIRGGIMRPRPILTALAAAILFALSLGLIPATHYVEAEGTAQPVLRRNLYAPMDGEVIEVHGVHEAPVTQGQLLVMLRSRELDRELERLQGEYQTTEKKLLAVASARVQSRTMDGTVPFPGRLAAEELELKQQLESQRMQIELVRNQSAELEVRSPIGGKVLTWDLDNLLSDRPVQRGQLLISVADLTGPWLIELDVSDRGIGKILAAQQRSESPLPVWFSLAPGTGKSYEGSIQQIALRTEITGGDSTATRVWVSVPDHAVGEMRPGATIHAKLDCGRRSLAYVWFHGIHEWISKWLLF